MTGSLRCHWLSRDTCTTEIVHQLILWDITWLKSIIPNDSRMVVMRNVVRLLVSLLRKLATEESRDLLPRVLKIAQKVIMSLSHFLSFNDNIKKRQNYKNPVKRSWSVCCRVHWWWRSYNMEFTIPFWYRNK